MIPSSSTAPYSTDPYRTDPWQPHPATIRAIHREIPSVFTLELELSPSPYADTYRFAPGQFNMLHLPGSGEVAISHSGPTNYPSHHPRSFLHTIRAVGRVTNAIEQLQVGDSLGVRGPFGFPWPIDAVAHHDLLIVSGGLGMAPLRPVIYSVLDRPDDFGKVDLLFGSRSPDTILYASELKAWSDANIGIETTVDRATTAWSGPIGPVTLLLDRRTSKSSFPNFQPLRTHVFICGPEVMMHYCALSALKLGIPDTQIWISMERNMQCGVGYCGHCQWGPFFLCKDGPVLRYDRARPYLNIKDL